MLNFILPTEQNRDDVLTFYDEIEKSGGECIGMCNYKNYDLWLAGMRNRHMGKICPKDMCGRISISVMKKSA